MQVEVSVALNFVISYLYNKLPRRRVNMFGEELEKGIRRKFEGHWYPDKPFKGSGFRCIRVSGEKIDPVIEFAAHSSGLDIEEIKDYLPADLTVWIDPCEVSYKIGEKGIAKILYSSKDDLNEAFDKEVQAVSKGFNPDAQCFKPIDSLSSSLSNLSLSPSSPVGGGGSSPVNSVPGIGGYNSNTPITPFLNRPNNTPVFTTAMFAQTKFGSTKLKSQSKRPARLSPTELSGFPHKPPPTQSAHSPPLAAPGQTAPQVQPQPPQQLGMYGLPAAARPRTLSPRDPRHNYVQEQQHRIFLAQHHHHQQQQQRPQQQQQHHPQHQSLQMSTGSASSSLPSPTLGGSLNDLYMAYQQAGLGSFTDLIGPQSVGPARGGIPPAYHATSMQPNATVASSFLQGSPSPDANKTFLEGIGGSSNNTLPPYLNLQHLLVAN